VARLPPDTLYVAMILTQISKNERKIRFGDGALDCDIRELFVDHPLLRFSRGMPKRSQCGQNSAFDDIMPRLGMNSALCALPNISERPQVTHSTITDWGAVPRFVSQPGRLVPLSTALVPEVCYGDYRVVR